MRSGTRNQLQPFQTQRKSTHAGLGWPRWFRGSKHRPKAMAVCLERASVWQTCLGSLVIELNAIWLD